MDDGPALQVRVHKIVYRERTADYASAGHAHPEWTEIFFVDRGAVEARLGETPRRIEQGSLVVVPPALFHSFRCVSDKAPNLLNILLRATGIRLDPISARPIRLPRDLVEHLRALLGDLDAGHPYPAAAAEGAVAHLLLRLLAGSTSSAPTGRYPRIRQALVDRVNQILEARHASPFTLELFSGAFPLTGDQLERTFREESGETLRDAHRRARVARAKALLRESALAVFQIAREVGYRHPGDFSRAFRRVEGVTPTEFMASVRPGAASAPPASPRGSR